MRKWIAVVAVVLLLGYLIYFTVFLRPLDTAGWQEAKPPLPMGEAVLSAEKQVYPPWTKEIQCVWSNYETEVIAYGERFELHKKVGNQWLIARRSDGMGIGGLDVAYLVNPGQSAVYSYQTSYAIDRLAPGEYRIAADYTVESKSGNSNDWQSRRRQAYANFIVR